MRSVLVLAVISVFTAFGCSGDFAGSITGTVTLDGKALADAEVRFCPKDDPKMTTNFARTRSDGTFQVKPDPRTGKTLQAGNYVVLISKMVQKSGAVPQGEDAGMLQASGELRNLVPPKYQEIDKSPFKVEIVKGNNALSPFELKSR